MTGNAHDFELRAIYSRLVLRARWVAVAAALGGLAGLGASSLAPPTFRATAVLNIGVDYGRSEWLDEDADRLVMGRVQDLILSDEVLTDVLERSASATPGSEVAPLSMTELRDDLRLVWVDNRWELSSASRDPQQAAAIANLWARVSLEHLQGAWERAWQVAELQSLYFRVFCQPVSVSPAEQSLWVCDERQPGNSSHGLPDELRQEILDSHGIIPALSFAADRRASVPERPDSSARPVVVLGGMLAGLLVGCLAALGIGESRA